MVTQEADGTLEFAFYRPGARTVRVAGDFNLWDPTRHELAPYDGPNGEDGWWRLRTQLAPGEYRFKYVVDGHHWETDFAAYGVEPDPTGEWNAVLLVASPDELARPRIEIDADADDLVPNAHIDDECPTDIDAEDDLIRRAA